ncbi:MerR family DNA-binding transcriptional regulator [Halobacillus litoralis]|uniref:Transcriptional regulator n=1 Tax=Halobacillus litoralis TaxID=45668 RepID=A0A410MDX5_9BACI|nr:MerR family DNA-binding transcriptional regulator [Halobacillus litoralis]QAS52932.1 transcriptional regulator [Halobacillus litoralis]
MTLYRPIDIARELKISTSALRHYESWGLVPEPERGDNGYRLYTEVHLAYFRCLRALFFGFGSDVARTVLHHIQKQEMDAAFWVVNHQQSLLYEEKVTADHTLKLLENMELPSIQQTKLKKYMRIGEVADFTGVNPSAIRHWEKEGLFTSVRNPENGYRLFTPTHVRKILLIHTLRNTVYFLDHMKEYVNAIEQQSVGQAKRVTENAVLQINERLRKQVTGIYELVALCRQLELM